MSEERWICDTCGTSYAEYVNGCPRCWDKDILSKVVHERDALPSLHRGETMMIWLPLTIAVLFFWLAWDARADLRSTGEREG
jgi:hypothetical protein